MKENRKMAKSFARRFKNISFLVFRIIMFAVLSLLVGINIYSWNARKLMGDLLPMPFGYGVAVVLSGSMEPVLSVDDIVIIKKTDDIKEKDIVVFQSGNSLIIHRVISVEGDVIQTQGDANSGPDDKINVSAVKGELAATIKGAGVITYALRSPVVIICIIALVLLLMEMGYKNSRKKETENIDKAKNSVKMLTEEFKSSDELDVEKLREMIEKIENELKDNNK